MEALVFGAIHAFWAVSDALGCPCSRRKKKAVAQPDMITVFFGDGSFMSYPLQDKHGAHTELQRYRDATLILFRSQHMVRVWSRIEDVDFHAPFRRNLDAVHDIWVYDASGASVCAYERMRPYLLKGNVLTPALVRIEFENAHRIEYIDKDFQLRELRPEGLWL
jgi:hypothetical protein